VFLAFVEQVLLPALRGRPDAVVVMDNLGAHLSAAPISRRGIGQSPMGERVRHAFEAAKVSYRHLPSHSPDLNPSGARHLIRSRRDRHPQAAEASPAGPSSRAG
jgi:hypothetical protein